MCQSKLKSVGKGGKVNCFVRAKRTAIYSVNKLFPRMATSTHPGTATLKTDPATLTTTTTTTTTTTLRTVPVPFGQATHFSTQGRRFDSSSRRCLLLF